MDDKLRQGLRSRAKELAKMEPWALLAHVAALLEFQATIADGLEETHVLTPEQQRSHERLSCCFESNASLVRARVEAKRCNAIDDQVEKMARGEALQGSVRYLGWDEYGNERFQVGWDTGYRVRIRLDEDRLMMAECGCQAFRDAATHVAYENVRMKHDPSRVVWMLDGHAMCEHVWAVLTTMSLHRDEVGSTWTARSGA